MTAGFIPAERSTLRSLKTPEKIQRFLDTIAYNLDTIAYNLDTIAYNLDTIAYNKEERGATCRSPRRVLRDRTAYCRFACPSTTRAIWSRKSKISFSEDVSYNWDSDRD